MVIDWSAAIDGSLTGSEWRITVGGWATPVVRKSRLDAEQRIIAGTIGVEVHHGVVKLAGRVGDDAIKEIAEQAARRVKDVTNVVADIDVTGASLVAQPRKLTRVA